MIPWRNHSPGYGERVHQASGRRGVGGGKQPDGGRHRLRLATGVGEGAVAVGGELGGVVSFMKEDCMNLSFPAERFDAVTAAFGIRNFKDLDKCLGELHRVLRKGGHLSIVDLSAPKRFPMSWLFKIYSHTVLPLYARLVSKDKGAYRYLISTVEAFPQGETMVGILKKAGFEEVKFKRLTFGICTMYLATK